MTHRSPHETGLTLLEMLLVVVILSVVAAGSISVIGDTESQFRHEDTRTRFANVKRAIVGDALATSTPQISGFVADVGRLPADLSELLERPTIAGGAAEEIPAWAYDSTTGLWAGWRGPYLRGVTEQDGTVAYRDGWGNAGAAPNYGWKTFDVSDANGTVELVSFGANGDTISGESGLDADYPPSGALVVSADHRVDLTGWQVVVTFPSVADGTDEDLRVRILYPKVGSYSWLSTWPSTPDSAKEVSAETELKNDSGATADVEVTFTFPEISGADREIPWGLHAVEVREADGTAFGASTNVPLQVRVLPRSALPDARITWDLN